MVRQCRRTRKLRQPSRKRIAGLIEVPAVGERHAEAEIGLGPARREAGSMGLSAFVPYPLRLIE